MQFNRRNINKSLRNGDIVASSLLSSYSSSSGSGGGGGTFSGNYLPANLDENGVYIVPHYVTFQESTTDTEGNEVLKNLLEITKDGIIVNGNIIARGEVSAYGSGSTSGNTSVGTIDIEDHLNSNRTDAALSANQGRLLKELIDNVEVDLSDYYNKSQIDYKLSNLNVDLSNYYNKIQIDEKLENLDDYYKKQEVDNKLNEKLDKSTWNDVFSIDSNGNLKIKVDVIGEGEISAYGSGATANTEVNLGNYYTKDEVDDLLDNIDVGDIDLSNYYTKTETTSNFASKSHTHSQYATSSHTHSTYYDSSVSRTKNTVLAAPNGSDGSAIFRSLVAADIPSLAISKITNLQTTLNSKSDSGHTHNYASTIKVGSTSYSSSANTISLPSYPTLSTLSGVSTSSYNTHTASTVHITSTERTNWNTAFNNNHTHSNKSVLDGITSTKVNNWDKVYTNWNNIFEIDSNGNLKIKVNVIGEGEISAYGSGATANTEVNLGNYYTKDEVDNLIDNIDGGNVDLSNYYTKTEVSSNFASKSHTHSQYASSSHTHSISNITNLQSTLDGKSGTGHSHSNYSLTSHTHSNYSLTSHTHSYAASTHTHPISAVTNLQSSLDAKSGTGHSHSNYSLTSHTHSYAASDHSHSNYSLTSHTHNYLPLSASTTTQVSNAQSGVVNFNSTASDTGIRLYNNGTNKGGLWWGSTTGVYLYNTTKGYYLGINDSGTPYFYDTAQRTLVHSGNSGHTHSISNITNLQSSLDAKSGTGHSHSNYSLTSHTHSAYAGTGHSHSNYSLTSHTHSAYYDSAISRTANTVLAAPNGSAGSATFRSLVAADIPTLAISKISGLQTALDGKAATHSHPYASSSHTHSTLTFSAGTFSAKSYNPSGATTVNIPTNTTHLTNGSGYITTAATVNAANKLATARTLWGQSFSGTANVSGNMTGVGSISASGNITTSAEITAHSDRRLKDDIQPLENRGYVTPYTYTKDGKKGIGFVAQEMQELYPELVSVDESSEEKYLSVNYMQYTAVLQKQILDLKDEINELKKIIKDKDIN